MGGVCSTPKREEKYVQRYGGQSEGMRPVGRPRQMYNAYVTLTQDVNRRWALLVSVK